MNNFKNVSRSFLLATFLACGAVTTGCATGGSQTMTVLAQNQELVSSLISQYSNLSPTLQNVATTYITNYATSNSLTGNLPEVLAAMDNDTITTLSGILKGLSSDSSVVSSLTDNPSLIALALEQFSSLSPEAKTVAQNYLTNYATSRGLTSGTAVTEVLTAMDTPTLQGITGLFSGLQSL